MVSDTTIAVGIFSIFIIIGTLIPFVNDEFGVSAAEINVDGLATDVASSGGVVDTTTTTFEIFISIFQMFFWTFGALPFWLDAFFIILRVTLVLIIVKIIRGVGG